MQRARLLIVEDDSQAARSMLRLLDRTYDVTLATSHREGASRTQSFDSAVLDIDLGDGDGVDLGRELLENNRVRSVVFYTGTTRPGALLRAKALGRVVIKGAPSTALLAAIREALGEATNTDSQTALLNPL